MSMVTLVDVLWPGNAERWTRKEKKKEKTRRECKGELNPPTHFAQRNELECRKQKKKSVCGEQLDSNYCVPSGDD